VHDHPFYLIAGVPAAAVLAAVTIEGMLSKASGRVFVGGTVIFILFALRFYIPPAFFSQKQGMHIPAIGKKIQEITNKNDKIVASYGSSDALLYYAHRFGWSFDIQMATHPLERQKRHEAKIANGYGDPVKWLEYLRSQEAKYFVVSEPEIFQREKTFFDYMQTKYRLAAEDESFRMYDLTAPVSP
jgi:hypothetical protein